VFSDGRNNEGVSFRCNGHHVNSHQRPEEGSAGDLLIVDFMGGFGGLRPRYSVLNSGRLVLSTWILLIRVAG